jgi:two-component system heavy metal sensor histidine kinase CusS
MSSSPGAEGGRAARSRRIAWRLTAFYAGASAVIVLGALAYLYAALAANLDREDDDALAEQVRLLGAFLREHGGDRGELPPGVAWESAARRYGRLSLRVLDARGRVLGETPGIDPALVPAAFPSPAPAGAPLPRGRDVDGRRGRAFRLVAVMLDAEPAGGAAAGPPGAAPGASREAGRPPAGRVLQVALDRTEEAELLAEFRVRSLPAVALVLVLCALVGHRIARQLLARTDEAFERLERFAADIAHQIRTPLSNLRGEIEVSLGRARSPDEYRELLASSLEECVRLSRLVERLLFLSRAESPTRSIKRERLELRRELEAVRDFYEPAAAEAGLALRVAEGAPVEADADRVLLQNAVANLVENAIAHTPPGGAVTLAAARAGPLAEVTVADTGRGIPGEHLGRVFDRFYRVAPGGGGGGTGLGLSIVKSVAELHGGAVAIDSAPGRGTRVTVRLPAGGGPRGT